MDDCQFLYKERGRVVKEVCQRYKVKNTTSNNSVADFINMSTHADNGNNHHENKKYLIMFYIQTILWKE